MLCGRYFLPFRSLGVCYLPACAFITFMNIQIIELITIGLCLGVYFTVVPKNLRRVNGPKQLMFAASVATILTVVLFITVRHFNHYTLEQLGIGISYMRDAIILNGLITFVLLSGIVFAGRKNFSDALSNKNFIKLILVYPIWAFVQQFLVLSITFNIAKDLLGILIAIPFTGLVFSSLHWGVKYLGAACFVAGCAWAAVFVYAPNLIPIAVSQGILASAYYYFVTRQDKWVMVVAPLYRMLVKK